MQNDPATESPMRHGALARRAYPVIEIFGPTIQGEGFLAGLPTHFVRFGGCDYRCSWCDSMYAVEPSLVREHAEHLTLQQIEARLLDLPGEAQWITLSGGNPALMPIDIDEYNLYLTPFLVSVETQGSIWRDWLACVDHLTVSPKPPSSSMTTQTNMRRFASFMQKAERKVDLGNRSIKIVVFDDTDYAWAKNLFALYPNWQHRYLSVGTAPTGKWGASTSVVVGDVAARTQVCDSYAALAERVANDSELRGVRVLPQLHVLAWGHARGV